MASQKGFFGGRVDKDGFHKTVTPDYVSAYPNLGIRTGGIIIKLATSLPYGRFAGPFDKTPRLALGFKYRNPEVYRKWYRPTLLELQVSAYNDPQFDYYLWKWSEHTDSGLIIIGETKEEYLARKQLGINSNYGKKV